MKLISTFLFLISFIFYCCADLSITVGEKKLDNNTIIDDIIEGEKFEFSCETTVPSLTITLESEPSIELPDGEGTPSNRQYTFPSVSRNISGVTFQCQDGQDLLSFSLNVQYAPEISNITNGAGPVGGTATVTFTVDANPAVTNDNIDINITPSTDPSKSVTSSDDGSQVVLHFTNLKKSDAGMYTVRVENTVGTSNEVTFELDIYCRLDTTLTVTAKGQSVPVDGDTIVTIHVTEGDDLNIICSTSIPRGTITPKTDPVLLFSSFSTDGSDSDRQYTLNNINRAVSMSTFTCSDALESASFTINVVHAPSISGIADSSCSVTGSVGGTATVTFTVDANPDVADTNNIIVTKTPVTKDDISVSNPSTDALTKTIDGSQVTLQYTDLQRSDAGIYTVRVENTVGISDERTFQLDIHYSPTISNIINGAGPVGGTATVTFIVDANPAVTNIIVTPLTDAFNDPSINGSQVTLQYTNLQRNDDGIYTVRVENTLGTSDEKTFELDIYFRPSFITTIEVTVGQPLTIDCTVSESNPSVTSIQLTGSDGLNRDITNTSSYTITDSVTIDYNGNMYTCEASNGETDNTQITFNVTVIEVQPVIGQFSVDDIEVVVGRALTIDCTILKFSSVTSILLRGSDGLNRDITDTPSYTITDSVTIDYNGTVYICVAFNGEIKTQIFIVNVTQGSSAGPIAGIGGEAVGGVVFLLLAVVITIVIVFYLKKNSIDASSLVTPLIDKKSLKPKKH